MNKYIKNILFTVLVIILSIDNNLIVIIQNISSISPIKFDFINIEKIFISVEFTCFLTEKTIFKNIEYARLNKTNTIPMLLNIYITFTYYNISIT